jgi:uncharacterized protein (DUF1330 family)
MPKGYVIFTETIRDQAKYDGYVQKAVPTLMAVQGRAIVLHDNPEVLEGKWEGKRVVILEFDSVDAARKWYNSPEYQAIAPERHACADADAIIVGGFEMPGG